MGHQAGSDRSRGQECSGSGVSQECHEGRWYLRGVECKFHAIIYDKARQNLVKDLDKEAGWPDSGAY